MALIRLPATMASWPLPRKINPYYDPVAEESAEWFRSFAAFSPEAQRAFDRCNFGLLAALSYPTLSREHYRAACDLMNLFFVFDEYTDTVDEVEARRLADISMNALRNPEKPRPAEESLIGEVTRQFWSRAIKYASPTSRRRFEGAWDRFTTSVIDQARDRTNARSGHIRTVEEHFAIRRYTIGAEPCYALAELPIDLPDDVWANPIIDAFRQDITDIILLDNDLASYNKEQAADDDLHNIITIVMHEKQIDLDSALSWLAAEHKTRADRILGTWKQIEDLKFSPEIESALAYYIDHLLNWPLANDCWNFESGNVLEIASQEKVGDLDTKWMQEYGGAWRIKDCFGANILMVADPKALQYICQKSGYDYPKDKRWTQLIRLVTGNGVAAAIGENKKVKYYRFVQLTAWIALTGDAHVRQRNAMNPAFTTTQLRQYVSVFQRTGAKLAVKWQTEILQGGNTSREVAVSKWLPRATLDALGEAAFSYQFDTLDDEDSNELARAYLSLFSNALYSGNKADFLWRAIWKFIPDNIMDLVKYVPVGDARRFAENWDMMKNATERLIDQKMRDGSNGKHKDLMDVMIETNASAVGSARVPKEELVAQVTTLFVAGHESIAITTDLLLWELAKRPDCQDRIREEISVLRRNVTQRDSPEELLRLHPTGYHVHRSAAKDDVIPLAKPIRLETGALTSEIPVEAGQNIVVSLWGYNRMSDVWGEDAAMFNPERFLSNQGRASNVGIYANIMTFSAGVRGCIGWRFAVLELLALAVELLENFQYDLSISKPDILPVARGPTTYPAPRSEEDRGPNLPLQVTLL
ncbi:hypothetical protein CERSUDRAFT_97863 [Gelatoporia subvermispora B]|uniref:Terpene synthase n=1 Tax=Ceriporiopsis subvermispora (strain B) TaxID=914234 RepID=M2QAJ1_CERS8|nr:hypothetical protein CERSUDRAFT_97863 [Gelatoporia subvermispora B]